MLFGDASSRTITSEIHIVASRGFTYESKLSKLQAAVLAILWKKKDQKEGKMWRASARSYNTAQKKKIEWEKVLVAREAMERNERLAEEAREAAAKEKKLLGVKEEDDEDGSGSEADDDARDDAERPEEAADADDHDRASPSTGWASSAATRRPPPADGKAQLDAAELSPGYNTSSSSYY